MKDRLFKMGKTWVGALCLLATCGMTYSCSDNYDLDTTSPSGFYSSIYDYLTQKGNFTNTVKLIEDLDYKEVLSKTGSKTLFVADDDAFAKFYANNAWGVTKYGDLNIAQKKLLLNASMLDNPYLLEMMSNETATSGVDKNKSLRQYTAAAVTDSIPFFKWDSSSIPTTNNASDKDYWARFRTQEKGGLYLALDASAPLMTHFLAGQMAEANITDGDFNKIIGASRSANDAHIFSAKVINQDISCRNGYVDQLDRVLLTPSNMAEVLRTNGQTSLFSHLLDRFSAPFYNKTLTTSYQQLHLGVDSVYEKRYFSLRARDALTDGLKKDPAGNSVGFYLSYDPGWNAYYNSSATVLEDMGAMFVPSDASFKKYFLSGGGVFLMEAYADLPNTEENLYHNVDQIPLNIIQALINNLMKASFSATVPSKYITIMNDARDPMFSNASTVSDFMQKIDTCLLANNGVVYVMNEVYTPAKYASVSAPALVGNNMKIFNWAISADDPYVTNPNSAPLNSFFSAYLLAMSSKFSFFVPTDESLGTYYDPVSLGLSQPRILAFGFNSKKASDPVTVAAYKYDTGTGEVGAKLTTSITATIRNNRLKDLLDGHIVVHTGTNASAGIESGNEYFITKGGSAIKVEHNGSTNPLQYTVKGGWQLLHEGRVDGTPASIKAYYDKTEKTNGYGNGMTYQIDHPIEATTQSVYSVLRDNDAEDNPYSEFYNLCQVDGTVLESAGFGDAYTTTKEKEAEYQKYYIFTSNTNGLDYNVRFFNAYRYTLYVPTNDAIKAAIANGLPTWTSISNYITEQKAAIDAGGYSDDDAAKMTAAYKAKAQAMVTYLVNFLRYHFQDNSIFADKMSADATAYETACMNTSTNRYFTVTVTPKGNNEMSVTDLLGNTRNVTSLKNVMTRDMELDATAKNASIITASSFAVVHQIDGVLSFTDLAAAKTAWSSKASTAAAKKFCMKYRIRK